jgi:hypothetical protein
MADALRVIAAALRVALIAALLATAAGAHAQAGDAAWDVVVVGGEPEAIAAAVAAAEEGARTLLVTSDPRVGGLFVRGALNVLDVRTSPVGYQAGLFERWWRRVGGGPAFDVARAERAFLEMLGEAGVAVRLDAGPVRPWTEGARVVGVVVGEERLAAHQVIDGTADADLAAAAGTAWTFGWRPLGLDARMADTLVFRVDGVDWSALQHAASARGRGFAVVGERAAHGAFDGHPAAYRPLDPSLGLRGLNLGRQDDGSVLVNALLVYGVNPFDPASLADGRARAAAEVPHVVAWLRALPGFANARVGGVAEALYVRQSRQVITRCTLTVDDVLDHVVTDLDVAAGGYPLDVQSRQPGDVGTVIATPEVFGARLCMSVPEGLDGLWVVGRSFGADPLAMSSARVVPFGMSLAEAVGVAAALAVRTERTPAEVAADPVAVRRVRGRLLARGAYLPEVAARAPHGPHDHPRYADYRAFVRWGLAGGGYGNEPRLDEEVPFSALAFALLNVAARGYGEEAAARRALARVGIDGATVAPERAVRAFAAFAAEVAPGALPEGASWATLRELGLGFDDPGRPLRRGEVYAFGRLLLDLRGGVSDPLAAAGPR